jgi:hypothetical protein
LHQVAGDGSASRSDQSSRWDTPQSRARHGVRIRAHVGPQRTGRHGVRVRPHVGPQRTGGHGVRLRANVGAGGRARLGMAFGSERGARLSGRRSRLDAGLGRERASTPRIRLASSDRWSRRHFVAALASVLACFDGSPVARVQARGSASLSLGVSPDFRVGLGRDGHRGVVVTVVSKVVACSVVVCSLGGCAHVACLCRPRPAGVASPVTELRSPRTASAQPTSVHAAFCADAGRMPTFSRRRAVAIRPNARAEDWFPHQPAWCQCSAKWAPRAGFPPPQRAPRSCPRPCQANVPGAAFRAAGAIWAAGAWVSVCCVAAGA